MPTDFIEATARFEDWLRTQVKIDAEELEHKHVQMAAANGLFSFFRGTYYRWAELWPQVCGDLQSAPQVLAVGDLHIENFGTWRDHEARLIWGINDFDDADTLPFTNDLVRLATSAIAGSGGASFHLSPKKICRAILSGYLAQLGDHGVPFVLEEDHPELRLLAMQADRDPHHFWKKMNKVLNEPVPEVPTDVEETLKRELQNSTELEIRTRRRIGMGSLGKPRYIALAKVMGARVAREAKALTPPATAFLDPKRPSESNLPKILSRVRRSADPFLRSEGAWIIRRLAPHCSRIELKQLDNVDDETVMFKSMGAEAANIHLGTEEAIEPVLQWLESRDNSWLESAAHSMLDATQQDRKAWRRHFKRS